MPATMSRLTSLCLLMLLSTGAFSQSVVGNDRAITPARLRGHLEFVANDLMEGRNTPSRGLDVTALYISTQLKLWGAQPAGDNGTFLQKIALSRLAVDPDASSMSFGGATFKYGDDFYAQATQGKVSGGLVFVSHGWVVPSKGINPYKGLDLRGKIAVVLPGMPEGVTPQLVAASKAGDYVDPETALQSAGAAGVVWVPDQAAIDGWSRSVGRSERGGFMRVETPREAMGGIPSVTASAKVMDAIFGGEKATAAEILQWAKAPQEHASFALSTGKLLNFDVETKGDLQWTQNVVAIVPGSDPALRKEFVAFGAHMDHLGMRDSGEGDRIYNGADDDGSGTVSILEIAHAFLTGPRPKRSLLFVWHCGEEKGLWGSSFFTDHPTVDLKNVVTQLNIDMIGRSKKAGDTNPANKVLTSPNEIYVVGSTKMSTDLQKTSETVNKGFLNLTFNYKYDDPKDPERIFYRSDHYNYARKGIPIIFYFDGVHEDYHRPSDEVTKIDFDKMSKVARTVYATGWTIANAVKRPVVDKPLGE